MKMRRFLILSLSSLLIIGLIAMFVFFYRQSHHLQIYPFADLSNENIVSVGVCANFGSHTATRTLLPNKQIELVSLLKNIQTAPVASPKPQFISVGGTSHMFVITLSNGEEIHVAAYKPFLIYNGQRFRADADSLNCLDEFYMQQIMHQ